MFIAIPTLAGQSAIAAAVAGQGDLVIAEMVVGDGNGSPVIPLETQTALVNPRAIVPISAVTRDANMATFDAELGPSVGPFTIREIGLLDADGVLLFVASCPTTEKLTPAQGAYDSLTLGLQVIVSDTAQVTLQPPPGSLISIADMLRAPWLSVESVSLTAPPSNPVPGAVYRLPPAPTGAWSGHANELAQWTGVAWVFKAVPLTHLIGDAANRQFWERTPSGWARRFVPPVRVTRARLHFHGCM